MTKEQAVVYVYAQSVAANIELMAMSVANAEAVGRGEKRPHSAEDFRTLSRSFGLGHNSILQVFEESL